MNPKVFARCALISLLLALPTPVLLFWLLNTGEAPLLAIKSADALFALDGIVQAYLKVSSLLFVILLLANLSFYWLSPHLALSTQAMDERETGTVKWFDANKGFGFITRDQGGDVFVHFRAIRGTGYKLLAEGQRVRFAVSTNDKGLQADDVSLVK